MTGTDVTPSESGATDLPPAVPDPEPAQSRRSPIWPVIGGAIAAVLGYGVAQMVPAGWPIGSDPAQIAALESAVQTQGKAVEALATQTPAATDTSALTEQITALQSGLEQQQSVAAAQAETLAALDARIVAVERQPATGGSASNAAVAAMETEVEALRTMIEDLQGQGAFAGQDLAALLEQTRTDLTAASDKAQALQTQFEQTATRATTRAAMLQITAALETGGPFSGALDDLASAGLAVPESLRAVAEGVPSLADLQAGFVEPSRAALSAALKATVGDDAVSRISAFVRNQVGARSLTAHQGTDPDAILSRAEAAVQTGDLVTALAEIATLPEEGRTPLAEWGALAQSRITAMSEVASLATNLGK